MGVGEWQNALHIPTLGNESAPLFSEGSQSRRQAQILNHLYDAWRDHFMPCVTPVSDQLPNLCSRMPFHRSFPQDIHFVTHSLQPLDFDPVPWFTDCSEAKNFGGNELWQLQRLVNWERRKSVFLDWNTDFMQTGRNALHPLKVR